nr:MAG TPA: hypothetical protein [Caudoviricetes sp.]
MQTEVGKPHISDYPAHRRGYEHHHHRGQGRWPLQGTVKIALLY